MIRLNGLHASHQFQRSSAVKVLGACLEPARALKDCVVAVFVCGFCLADFCMDAFFPPPIPSCSLVLTSTLYSLYQLSVSSSQTIWFSKE